MLKTDHNLKLLEKKVRQAAGLIDELRKGKNAAREKEKTGSYNGLPLLQGMDEIDEPAENHTGWPAERARLKTRIRKLMSEIEKHLD